MYILQNLTDIFGKFLTFTMVVIFPLLILTMLICMMIVPITFIFALVTGQSYWSVCDESDFIYKVNSLGRNLWIVFVALFLISLISYIFI